VANPTTELRLADVDLADHDNFREAVPHEMFALLRREDPVHWQPEPDGPGFWCVTKHADILQVHKDWESFSSERGGTSLEDLDPEQIEVRKSMIDMDPPRHNALRAIVNRDFTPRAVRRYGDQIKALFRSILDEALPKREFDFVAEIAAELPMRVFAEMLGAPEADRRYLVELGDRMLGHTDPEYAVSSEELERSRNLPFSNPAALEMFEYAKGLAAERRRRPRDDIVTKLVEARVDGAPLSEREYDVYFLLLAVAGNETTRHSISHGLLALIDHRAELERLRSDPTLYRSASEEILRWATPVHHFRRTATRDVELGGKTIREGDKVVMWYVSSNRDESRYDDPDRFDVRRNPEHQAFGAGGRHFCLGTALARLELRVLFEETLARFPAMELAGAPAVAESPFINQLKTLPVLLSP